MDIEKHFQEIAKNPDASLPELDELYTLIVDTLSANPQKLNEQINKLKTICLSRAIDHSKYKYRETISPVKPSRTTSTPSKSASVKDQALVKSSVDVKNIVEICREKSPFLSFGMLRLKDPDPKIPEKFQILYSKRGDENWINKNFRPDLLKDISNIAAEKLDQNYSWVLLCLFCSSDDEMIAYTNMLIEKNPEIKILDLLDLDKGEDEAICWKKSRESLFSETFSGKRSILISDLLNAEQECLIKSFFGSNVNFLVYSELTGGYSGARVILIFANISPGDQRKYVIKICRKSEGKLKTEYENFENFVTPYWVARQHMTAQYKESSRYQAIQYPFASDDTINLSIPFKNKYWNCNDGEELKIIIDKIFDHELCEKWRNITQKRTLSIEEAFRGIVNHAQCEASLNYLLSPNFSKEFMVDRDKLNKVLSSKINFFECLNHGDLRVDNIQVDKKSSDVFLIDFGFTGQYPAGLDYAALETSIRFNLLDYSADLKILEIHDMDPLLKFDNLIVRGQKIEGEVDKAQKICSAIRERFLNDFSVGNSIADLKIQYLFCLLALCVKQMQYSNLNRRYILQVISQIVQPLYDYVTSM